MSPRIPTVLWALIAVLVLSGLVLRPQAADPQPVPAYEYATLRWDGPENTHVIRPDGSVQSVGPQLRELRVPSRTDARAFYMTTVLNALAREGYELVATVQSDAMVLRRRVR